MLCVQHETLSSLDFFPCELGKTEKKRSAYKQKCIWKTISCNCRPEFSFPLKEWLSEIRVTQVYVRGQKARF